jgi:hypothetical protein
MAAHGESVEIVGITLQVVQFYEPVPNKVFDCELSV